MGYNIRKGVTRSIFISLASAYFCLPLPAAAQQDPGVQNGAQWYQVELLVFERRHTSGAPAEGWPRNLALAYPPTIQYLLAPDGQHPGTAVDSVETSDALSQEQPFTLLKRDQLQLADSARGIQRDANLRVIFHQAWRQPMVSFEQAPAVIVSGGEKFDEHYELEGSVTFSVSRYLHMHTNLWLTEFEANYGQTIGQWPPLPKQPSKPGEFTDTPSSMDLRADPQLGLKPWNSSETTYNTGGSGYNGGQQNETLPLNYGYLSQQPFVTKNIIALQQQRRMRSGELHYVDHPRLGILVLITSYDLGAGLGTVR